MSAGPPAAILPFTVQKQRSSAKALEPVAIGSAVLKDPTYAMQVRLTPMGAGVVDVTLNEFDAARKSRNDPKVVYKFETPVRGEPQLAALATQKLIINGVSVDLWNEAWTTEKATPNSVTFSVTIVRGAGGNEAGVAVAKITKTYALQSRVATNGASDGYEVAVTQTIENLEKDRSITVHAFINGTTPPPSEMEQETDRTVMGGYTETGTKIDISQLTASDFKPEAPKKDLTLHSASRFLWAGQASAYFAAIVLPDPSINARLAAITAASETGATVTITAVNTYKVGEQVTIAGMTPAGYNGTFTITSATPGNFTYTTVAGLAEATAFGTANAQLFVSAEAKDPNAPLDRSVALTFETVDIVLPPAGQTEAHQTTLPLTVFFGPKWREVVANGYFKTYPRSYDLTLNVQSRMCFLPESCSSWCSWPFLINALVYVLIFFHKITRDWGLAIICLVGVVRICLHPITKRSQVKIMGMSKMGPAIEKLKEKYADQPEVLNREMVKVYKQQGGAVLGCLPMFLQSPIWFALYAALQGTFELRQAQFLWGWTWIKDLARPDALFYFEQPINLHLFGWHLHAINLLPILMAAVTFINQKYFMPQPIPVAVTASNPEKRRKQEEQKKQQETQQTMNKFMPLMFPFIMYSMPSGLNLYYLTSMSLQIIESKIIRDHIKKHEELEKLRGPELVPTKPSRGSRRGGDKTTPEKPAKPGMIERFMEAMRKAQEQAEEMKKDKGKGK